MEVIRQVRTQGFPLAVQYTRLMKRSVYNKQAQLVPVYSVATANNCIQGNYDTLAAADAHYSRLAREYTCKVTGKVCRVTSLESLKLPNFPKQIMIKKVLA